MSEYAPIVDYAEAAPELLRSDLRRPRLSALVAAFGSAIQMVEDAAAAVESGRRFANATGRQLDLIGAIVGEPRQLANDQDYRRFIQARQLANKSTGTGDEIFAVLQTIAPHATIELHEQYPAGFSVVIITPTPPSQRYVDRLSVLLSDTRAAGVQAAGVWATEPYFGFNNDPRALGYNQGALAFSF